MGKTTWLKAEVRTLRSRYKHVLVYDFLGHDLADLAGENVRVIQFVAVQTFLINALRLGRAAGPVLVAIDEIDMIARKYPAINFLYRYGRHYNVDVIGVSRRFYDLDPLIRGLTDRFILFKITERRDLDLLRDLRAGAPEIVQGLRPFQYLELDV